MMAISYLLRRRKWLKQYGSQSGSPTAYYRGNVGIGTETPNALEPNTDLAGTGDRMVVGQMVKLDRIFY